MPRIFDLQRLVLAIATFAVLALGSALTARADVITFSPTNSPQANEENILLNTGTSGFTVFGVTNQTQLQVQFTSTTDILSLPSMGQARVTPTDGLLNNITISVPGGSFEDLIFNAFFGTGTAFVTVTTTSGQVFSYTLGNGQNYATIVNTTCACITSVTIDAAGGFLDLREVRISGAHLNAPAVPEPASMLLLGTGLVGVAGAARRRFKK